MSQQLTTPLQKTHLSFRRVKLKSNFIELAPGEWADAYLERHYGLRIPGNRPSDFYTMQNGRFFSEFSKKRAAFSFRVTEFILGAYYSDCKGKIYGLVGRFQGHKSQR